MRAGVTPEVALQSNTSEWMMLDLSLVSLDGATCNKVGTSYGAFQFQSARTLFSVAMYILPQLHVEHHACMMKPNVSALSIPGASLSVLLRHQHIPAAIMAKATSFLGLQQYIMRKAFHVMAT